MSLLTLLDSMAEIGPGQAYDLGAPYANFTFQFIYDGDKATVEIHQSIDGVEFSRTDDFIVTSPGFVATRSLHVAPFIRAVITEINGGALTCKALLL